MKARWREFFLRMTGAVGLFVGAGCLSVPIPQAETDPARFYVLSTVTPPGAAAAMPADEAAKAPAIQLLPVEVASYLKARTLVVRQSEHEIQFREFARWGEPLELGVARVLREELLARGAAASVSAGGVHAASGAVSLALKVRVLACEGGADGRVLFRAAWELMPTGMNVGTASAPGAEGRGGVKRGDFSATDLRWDGKSEAGLAAQLSAAVAGLAGEIAAAVRK